VTLFYDGVVRVWARVPPRYGAHLLGTFAGLALAGVALAGCATQPEVGREGEVLPNAGAGPFRELAPGELGNQLVAPVVVKDAQLEARSPSVLDDDGDPATLAVTGFFATGDRGDGATTALTTRRAPDGRSFDRFPELVLEPSLAWEGGVVASPSALRAGGVLHVYYAAEGGIGLARDEGGGLTKLDQPVLGPLSDTSTDEEANRTPRSPSVTLLPDGTWWMVYESAPSPHAPWDEPGLGSVLAEAISTDGIHWERLGTVLAPGAAGSYDDAAVGSPAVTVAESALGRTIARVYYAARDATGRSSIGLAARFWEEGGSFQALERAVSPVFGSERERSVREPCVLSFAVPGARPFSLLFATQDASASSTDAIVAGGVAPADAELPPPVE
jgi:hypothetical protein